MRKTRAGATSVLSGREHGAEKQHDAIWILMIPVKRLADQVRWRAADLLHRTHSLD